MGKKGGKGKGKGKVEKPSWMSEETFALSRNIPQLIDNFRGPSDKSVTPLTITKARAGLFLWQLLYSNDKKTLAARDEAIKLECIEATDDIRAVWKVAVKNLASCDLSERSAATGLLTSLLQSEAGRDVFLASKPPPIPVLLSNLKETTASLVAHTCGILKILAGSVDSKLKLVKGMKEWDWSPLVCALRLHCSMPKSGGNAATAHAAAALDFLLSDDPKPEDELTANDKAAIQSAREGVVKASGMETFVKICLLKSPTMAKAASVHALHTILLKCNQSQAKSIFLSSGGIRAMIGIISNGFMPLTARGAAAGCLWVALLPDKCIDQDPEATLNIADCLRNDGEPSQELGDISNKKPLAEEGLRLVIESQLLDEETKGILIQKVHEISDAGGIRYLVQMCAGPEGPLPTVIPGTSSGEKKKDKIGKKGKKGKKKAGKLEPGMDVAQTYGSGCLRLISLKDQCKEEVMRCGAVRYLTPLLDSKIHYARWNTRQVLLNLAMLPEYASEMALYSVPNYITGANIPKMSWPWERPYSSPVQGNSGLNGMLEDVARPGTSPVPGIPTETGF